MALLPVTSIQYDNESTGNNNKTALVDRSNLHMYHCTYVATTAGVGAAYPIGLLPAGEITIHPSLSRLVSSAYVSTADIDVGYAAYVEEDGTAVVADPNGWFDSVDAGGGAKDLPWSASPGILTTGPVTYESQEGIPITFSVDTADMSIGDTLDLYVAYTGGSAN